MLSPVELITPSGGPLQPSTPTLPICGSLPDKTSEPSHLNTSNSQVGPLLFFIFRFVRASKMPSQLEGAMDALIAVFYNYSGHDGDKYKLNKGELKQLLHAELTDFLTVTFLTRRRAFSLRFMHGLTLSFDLVHHQRDA